MPSSFYTVDVLVLKQTCGSIMSTLLLNVGCRGIWNQNHDCPPMYKKLRRPQPFHYVTRKAFIPETQGKPREFSTLTVMRTVWLLNLSSTGNNYDTPYVYIVYYPWHVISMVIDIKLTVWYTETEELPFWQKSSLAAPKVVIWQLLVLPGDEDFIKMITFPFEWCTFSCILYVWFVILFLMWLTS